MPKKSNDPWKQQGAYYERMTLPDGRCSVKGALMVNGVLFAVTANEQRCGEYLMRGRVSALSPRTGEIIRASGQDKRDRCRKNPGNESTEVLNITRNLYCHSINDSDIKVTAEKTARKLCQDALISISNEVGRTAVDARTPAWAVKIHGIAFVLSDGKVSEGTMRRKLNKISSIAAALDSYTMENIPTSALKKLYKELGNHADEDFRLCGRFWTYCADKGLYLGGNPFSEYQDKYHSKPSNRKKDAEKRQMQAVAPQSIPIDVEHRLNVLIENAEWDNSKATGLLLVKELGLNAVEVCRLCWGDFLQDELFPGSVQLQRSFEDSAGATHDYLRPCSPFAARELKRRIAEAKVSWPKGWETHTVCKTGSKALTAYCREQLLHAGMEYNDLVVDKRIANGVGIQLLHKNLRLRLSRECGLQEDGAAIKYLFGQSLSHDVTADHYRGFSNPEGQMYLYKALCRDKRFEPDTEMKTRIEKKANGSTEILVPAKDNEHTADATITIHLQQGQYIVVSAAMGLLEGEARIVPTSN